jgi:hypothetical protein
VRTQLKVGYAGGGGIAKSKGKIMEFPSSFNFAPAQSCQVKGSETRETKEFSRPESTWYGSVLLNSSIVYYPDIPMMRRGWRNGR